MDYLPLFFDLRGKPVLLVGGGSIALRKARLLSKANAVIRVVAPDIGKELETLAVASGGNVLRESYSDVHLDQVVLVISATDNTSINRQVAEDCHARRLPVNVVDTPELCSVIMPAIVDRSPLMIGISSGGEAPVLARMVRAQIESAIPGAYGRLADLASRFRERVKSHFPDGESRRRFWERVLNGPAKEMTLAGDLPGAAAYLEDQLASPQEHSTGEVYLVGAGPGDPDLLTFKALRLMQQAEVVLYDRLVSEPILDLVRRDAERIYVGKQRAAHTLQQTEINQLLLDYALQGKRVLRLKGGDPFIFGRGGEEIELLAQHKVPFQVVPGITAASGCACYAGIPLTHRDYAQSVRFVTGHLKNGTSDLSWDELIGSDQTLVFYMGLASLTEICRELIAHGKDPATPAALIEQGTTPRQQVHIATLADLPARVAEREVHAPTLLIIGGVVSLHEKLRWFSPDRGDTQ
ncbi:MAG: siroheme synthase CysG [Cellvibrionaceae bacterium]|nr:siroheme synthase CysG [Cellvibrionaceae bacterium]